MEVASTQSVVLDFSNANMNKKEVCKKYQSEMNENIRILNLSGMGFNDEDHALFAVRTDSVRELYLDGNSFGDKGIGAFALKSVTHLSMKKNSLSKGAVRVLLKKLNRDNIRILNVSNTKLDLEGMQQIALWVKDLNGELFLDLSGNPVIDKRSLQILCTSTYLTKLEVRECEIDDPLVKKIVKALKKNQSLYSLNLAHNKITAAGAYQLALGLQNNQSLGSLDLEGNRLEDKGVVYIASALPNNRTLLSLNLSETGIGQEGVSSFEVSLQSCHSLVSLIGLTSEKIKRKLQENQEMQDKAFEACRAGNEEEFRRHYDSGLSILGTHEGDTFLHVALQNKHFTMSSVLVDLIGKSSLLHKQGSSGNTPKEAAKQQNYIPVMNQIDSYTEKAAPISKVEFSEIDFYKNMLNGQIERMQKEKLHFEGKILKEIELVSNQKIMLARDIEVIVFKKDILKCVIEEKDPREKLVKQIFQRALEYYIGLKVRFVLKQESLDQEVKNLYERWCDFERSEIFSAFSSSDEETIDMSIIDALVSGLKKEIGLYQTLKENPFFNELEKIWVTHHALYYHQVKEEIAACNSQGELMQMLYRYEVLYFYEIDVLIMTKDYIDRTCSKMSKYDRSLLVEGYMKVIKQTEQATSLQYRFPEDNLPATLQKLEFEETLISQQIDLHSTSHEDLMNQFYTESEKQTNKIRSLSKELEETLSQIPLSLVYLAAFGDVNAVRSRLEDERKSVLPAATEEVPLETTHLQDFVHLLIPKKKEALIDEKCKEKLAELINTPNQNGQTALQQACFYGQDATVKLLLEQGANPKQPVVDAFNNAYYPYHFACYCFDPSKVVKILNDLYSYSKEVAQKGARGRTPLHTAALLNNFTAAEWFLNFGAEINVQEAEGTLNTPLHNACMHGSLEVCELFLKNGAKTDLRDDRKQTPLMLALVFGVIHRQIQGATGVMIESEISPPHLEIVKLFRRNGVVLSESDFDLLNVDEQTMPHIRKILALSEEK